MIWALFVLGFIVGAICGAVALFCYALGQECRPMPVREPVTLDENAGIPTG